MSLFQMALEHETRTPLVRRTRVHRTNRQAFRHDKIPRHVCSSSSGTSVLREGASTLCGAWSDHAILHAPTGRAIRSDTCTILPHRNAPPLYASEKTWVSRIKPPLLSATNLHQTAKTCPIRSDACTIRPNSPLAPLNGSGMIITMQ